MDLKIKKINEYAKMPTRGTEYSAGLDLYAAINDPVTIRPGQIAAIDTGLAMEIPKGYFGAIYPRSGLATKAGLRLANCVGR